MASMRRDSPPPRWPAAEATLDRHGIVTDVDEAWRSQAVTAESTDLLLCRCQTGDSYLQASRRAGGIGPAAATHILKLAAGEGTNVSLDYRASDSVWRLTISALTPPSSGVRLRHERVGDTDESLGSAQMRCLSEMANELLLVNDEATFLRRAVELPREQLGLTRTALLLVEADELRGSYGTDFDGCTADERTLQIPVAKSHEWPHHLRSRSGHEARWDLQIGARSCWTPDGPVEGPVDWIGLTPVASATEVLGIFSNDAGLGDEPYDPQVQEVLAVYAALLGGMLAQRNAERAEQRTHRRMALLHEVSAAVAGCASPEELAMRLGPVLHEVLPIDAFFLQAYDYSTHLAQVIGSFDTIDGVYQSTPSREDTSDLRSSAVFERLTREPGPIVIDRRSNSPLAERLQAFGDADRTSASLVFLPIIRGQRLEGVMSAQSYEPEAFDDEAVDLLGAVAAQIAPVLEGVRLRAELSAQAGELQAGELRYRAILAASSGVVYERDERDGRYVFVGEGIEHLTGYAADDLTGERLDQMVTDSLPIPITETPLLAAARRLVAFDRMTVSRRNLRLVTRDGRILWLADTAVLLEDDAGRPHLTMGLLRDITAAREAERHKLQLAALIEQMQDAVLVTDRELAVQYVNPAFEHLTGFAAAELVGRSAIELACPPGADEPPQLPAIRRAMNEGQNWRGRLDRPRQDGTSVPVDAAVAAVHDHDGRVVGYVDVERDLRPLEAIAERLRQTARMEAVGRLASGLAHDFNNLLTTILGYADLLAQTLPQGEPAAEDAAEIVVAAHRATLLTQQLLVLSRQRRGIAQAIDLCEFIDSLRPIIEAIAAGGIGVEMDLSALPQKVWVDPDQFERALLDLIGWSVEAMECEGELTFATQAASPPPGLLNAAADNLHDGPWLCLEIASAGQGLTEQQRERIFEPFLSHAGPTVTTRLGLATAYSLISQNHGVLECLSAPGQGTRFRIWLPPYFA